MNDSSGGDTDLKTVDMGLELAGDVIAALVGTGRRGTDQYDRGQQRKRSRYPICVQAPCHEYPAPLRDGFSVDLDQ